MKHQVVELEGAALDLAVARLEGWALYGGQGDGRDPPRAPFSPSTSWEHGGPIIDRERISLTPPEAYVHRHGGPNAGWGESGMWTSTSWKLRTADGRRSLGYHETSPLIAAMRLFVRCKLGDEVELP